MVAGDDGIAAQRGRHHRACDHGVAARGSHRALVPSTATSGATLAMTECCPDAAQGFIWVVLVFFTITTAV